uniref:Uncharacterized protein n=1 Tax=Candidatus Kentrum sp. MB TaxID=2138164 RepID=A0A450XRW7_9GAMM|nr:MAG: hypothetical protein BECKMB1821G_GA0114241_11013 [Candidatus Kentron sp. MB]
MVRPPVQQDIQCIHRIRSQAAMKFDIWLYDKDFSGDEQNDLKVFISSSK